MKLISSALLTISALTATALPAQTPAVSISLEEAMKRALQSNPATARARVAIDLAESQRRFVRSSILPHIDLYGSASLNTREVTFGSGDSETTILPENDWMYRFALTQPVYAGGRDLKTLRQARLGIEDASENVRASEEFLLLQTATNYLGVLQGDALIDVENKNLTLAERMRKQASDFLEAGEVTRVDVLKSETAIKSAQRRLASAAQFRHAAESRLRLNLAIEEPIILTTPALRFPALPTRAELIQRAEAQRPEILRAEIARRVAVIEVSKQKARYLPVVSAEASYTTQKVNFPADQFGALTLNFSVPIFQSGEIGAQVAIARQRQKERELFLDETRRDVRESIELALLELTTSETNLALAREQVISAEAEYQQIFELYQAQEATALDVGSAESSLAEARRAVVTGGLERDLAELRIWHAAGSLKQVILQEQQ